MDDTIFDLRSSILDPHAYGSSNGLDTTSENLKLKFGTCDQVAPPSMEVNEKPKSGASLEPPGVPAPSRPMSDGKPLTPGNGVVVGTCSTMKRFWILPFSIPF